MGLKCSVLGHKYGDASVERDREEQGSEVVITIREIETCGRCGEERVVSENKEVTSIATPDDPSEGEAVADAASEPGDADATDADDDSDDGDQGGRVEADDDAEPAEPTPADEVAPPVDANEGAEILDAEADAPVTDDELADPSIEDAAIGGDPVAEEPVEEDAVIMGEDDDEVGRAPGEWPEEPADADDGEAWTPSDALDDEQSISAPDAGTDHNSAVTVPDGQFRCPECGYTTLVESSSLRAGDFCPDCHKGSLVHEPEDGTRKE